jgi:uncharacterized membrane-anchored protein
MVIPSSLMAKGRRERRNLQLLKKKRARFAQNCPFVKDLARSTSKEKKGEGNEIEIIRRRFKIFIPRLSV